MGDKTANECCFFHSSPAISGKCAEETRENQLGTCNGFSGVSVSMNKQSVSQGMNMVTKKYIVFADTAHELFSTLKQTESLQLCLLFCEAVVRVAL